MQSQPYSAPRDFDEFMRRVDSCIARLTGGLVSADLTDYIYRDAYDAGERPAHVARAALAFTREG